MRLNIAYAISFISWFAKNLSKQCIKTVKPVMQNLKATKTMGIIYDGEDKENLVIKRYSDSDWAKDHITRKLILGFIFMLNSGLVS